MCGAFLVNFVKHPRLVDKHTWLHMNVKQSEMLTTFD